MEANLHFDDEHSLANVSMKAADVSPDVVVYSRSFGRRHKSFSVVSRGEIPEDELTEIIGQIKNAVEAT